MKFALLSLSALLILVTNHPDLDNKVFWQSYKLKTRVFDKRGPQARFASETIPPNTEE